MTFSNLLDLGKIRKLNMINTLYTDKCYMPAVCLYLSIIIFSLRNSGITEKDQMMIFQIQSAVLHFGNVKIREADGESSEIKVSQS